MDFPWKKDKEGDLQEQLRAHLKSTEVDAVTSIPAKLTVKNIPEWEKQKETKQTKEIKTMGYWDTHPIFEDNVLKTPPFIPEFRTVFGYGVSNTGQPISWPMNSDYFASQPTAQWIATKFGDGIVYEAPFFESGPFAVSAAVYVIKLKDGRLVNAGILAAYYTRNPEDKFPGLAEKLIRSQLGI